MNPELGGVTFGWNLLHNAQDELFAAIEGTAFHTRIILERMAEHGVPVERVINAGGIPQSNAVLNQIYADVLGKPVLVPDGTPTSLGSGIFALLAAGAFKTVEEAQKAICLPTAAMLRRRNPSQSITSCFGCIAMRTSLWVNPTLWRCRWDDPAGAAKNRRGGARLTRSVMQGRRL